MLQNCPIIQLRHPIALPIQARSNIQNPENPCTGIVPSHFKVLNCQWQKAFPVITMLSTLSPKIKDVPIHIKYLSLIIKSGRLQRGGQTSRGYVLQR